MLSRAFSLYASAILNAKAEFTLQLQSIYSEDARDSINAASFNLVKGIDI